MKTYIALLRGINVAGQKKVPMKQLRDLLGDAGYHDVQTYIQSGNVIFRSLDKNISKLRSKIQALIFNHFGFEVPVLLITPEEVATIIQNYPFENEKLEQSYFILLHDQPAEDLVISTSQINMDDEEFKITDNCVYLFSVKGYGKAKANNNFFEKKLKVSATTRNYKTMQKLLTLSS